MATHNNIFMTAGEPLARYARVPSYGITGWRLNPDDNLKKIEFSLVPTNDDFDYERDVIELYSDKEIKFFKQANRYLFAQGLLKDYEGTPVPIDVTNMLTDSQVLEFASERSIKRLEVKLQEITSAVSMKRVYDTAVEIGRPAKTLTLMKTRLEELQAN